MIIAHKIAVVTGAASGIGNAIAHRLIVAGANKVAFVDRAATVDNAAADANQRFGGDVAIAFQGNVTASDFRIRVYAEMQQFGGVSICVPAAGILRDAMAVKVNRETGKATLYAEQQFRQVLEVNLIHPVYWSMQMIAGIAERRAAAGFGKWNCDEDIQGVAIIVGSVSARGNRGQIAYSSAKSGLNAAAKTLNQEGASLGVQAKIIHPGFVQTPMLQQLPDAMFEQRLRPLIPIDRLIRPAEIADIMITMIENPSVSGPVWADGGLPPMS